MTEITAVHNQWTYTTSGRHACQDFSFMTVLEECDLPKETTFGDRLKAEIDRLGLSYNEFGAKVAATQRPPREEPYRKNNVEHWVRGNRRPNQSAWAAILKITEKPLDWFVDAEPSVPRVAPKPASAIKKVAKRHYTRTGAARKRRKGSE